MKHITPTSIRCHHCGNIYTFPGSANSHKRDLELRFALCPHCKYSRDENALRKYWGKPRCWGCNIPFELFKEYSGQLCYSCYRRKWQQLKQVGIIPKEEEFPTIKE